MSDNGTIALVGRKKARIHLQRPLELLQSARRMQKSLSASQQPWRTAVGPVGQHHCVGTKYPLTKVVISTAEQLAVRTGSPGTLRGRERGAG